MPPSFEWNDNHQAWITCAGVLLLLLLAGIHLFRNRRDRGERPLRIVFTLCLPVFLLPAILYVWRPDTLRITADTIEVRCNLFTYHISGDDLRNVESQRGTGREGFRFYAVMRDRDRRVRIPFPKEKPLEFKSALQTFCSNHHVPIDWPEPLK